MDKKKYPSLQYRNKIVFGIIVPIFIVFIIICIALNSKNLSQTDALVADFFHKKSTEFIDNFKKSLYPKPTTIPLNIQIPHISPSIITETPTPSPFVTITPRKKTIVYPTSTHYLFPTIKPGDPGSKEWEDEFNKKFEEMKRQNEQNQKNAEEAQKQFCIDHPTLCN